MATPMTPDQWLTALREEGVTVEEYPGWRTRGRDAATGRPFGPVRMFLNHHTAGRNARDVVAKNGVAGLPGPLAHVYLARSGVATMCSAGRTNHAGPMAANAYASFRDEKSTHPAPSKASGTIDGNDVSYGLEAENRGDNEDVYPRAQYDAWVRIDAAACRFHGWGPESVGCHKETSVEGKIDPRGPVEGYGSRGRFAFTPGQFRADVAERLAHPASWSPGDTDTQPDPTPTPVEETDVPDLIAPEVEAGGPELVADEWTLLRVAADTALAQGPCRYQVTAYVQVTGEPGTHVEGRFHDLTLATKRASLDLPQDGGIIPESGVLSAAFTRPGGLAAGVQLKLEVKADAPARVTYRLLRGLRWAI